MKRIPSIKSVMTPFPFWIDSHETLQAAYSMMQEHDISHLPVKEGGELLGVLSMRDVSAVLANTEFADKDIAHVCSRDIYVVDIDEPLDNVVLHMANNHIVSALVVGHNRLAGVFTMSDACRSFAEFLRYQFRPLPGDDVA